MSGEKAVQVRAQRAAGRQVQYDFVRVVAMTFVILVHSLVLVDTSTTAGAYYLTAAQSVFFSANAIFFILSGKFNLTQRAAEDPARFYLKKARGILLPVLVLFFVRTLYDLYPDFGSLWNVVKAFIKNTLGNYSSMEYWFVFQLISFLVVVPFLAPGVSSMDIGRKRLFFGIGMLWFLALFVTSNRGTVFSWRFLFTGFAFPFFLGPFVEDLFESSRARRVVWVCAPLCVIVTTWLVMHGWSVGAFDNSPFYMLFSVSLYLMLVRAGNAIKGERAQRVISFVASHSFTVYMVHMMVLTPLSRLFPAVGGAASIGAHVFLALLTLVLSLGIAVLVDLVLIRPLQRLFDIIARRLVPQYACK